MKRSPKKNTPAAVGAAAGGNSNNLSCNSNSNISALPLQELRERFLQRRHGLQPAIAAAVAAVAFQTREALQ